MNSILKMGGGAALAGLILLCAGQAQATTSAPVALSTLDTATSSPLVVGNTTFSNFRLSNPGSYGPADTAIGVATTENTPSANDVGVRFTASWNSTQGYEDSVISYEAKVANGANINGVYLDFNGSSINNAGGNAYATVTETVQDATTGNVLGQLTTFNGSVSSGITNVAASTLQLNGNYTDLILRKDIMVTATPGGSASITFVDNAFMGTNLNGGSAGPVPEPMSLALIPLGLVALGLRKKIARAAA